MAIIVCYWFCCHEVCLNFKFYFVSLGIERVMDPIWHEIGKCLNIQPKHIVLGLADEHYVKINRHLCIIIVAFSIYSIWCKCSFEKLNYSNVNLRSSIEVQFGILLGSFLVCNA